MVTLAYSLFEWSIGIGVVMFLLLIAFGLADALVGRR